MSQDDATIEEASLEDKVDVSKPKVMRMVGLDVIHSKIKDFLAKPTNYCIVLSNSIDEWRGMLADISAGDRLIVRSPIFDRIGTEVVYFYEFLMSRKTTTQTFSKGGDSAMLVVLPPLHEMYYDLGNISDRRTQIDKVVTFLLNLKRAAANTMFEYLVPYSAKAFNISELRRIQASIA